MKFYSNFTKLYQASYNFRPFFYGSTDDGHIHPKEGESMHVLQMTKQEFPAGNEGMHDGGKYYHTYGCSIIKVSMTHTVTV